MKKLFLFIGSMGLLVSMPSFAADLSIGDPKTESGELKLSGANPYPIYVQRLYR